MSTSNWQWVFCLFIEFQWSEVTKNKYFMLAFLLTLWHKFKKKIISENDVNFPKFEAISLKSASVGNICACFNVQNKIMFLTLHRYICKMDLAFFEFGPVFCQYQGHQDKNGKLYCHHYSLSHTVQCSLLAAMPFWSWPQLSDG